MMIGGSSRHMTGERITSVSGIVLAGGKSVRMGGCNKALLDVGGAPILSRVVSVLDTIFEEVILITNSPKELEFINKPMFPDLRTGKGSFGGLWTGLHHCNCEYGFLVACDMPFLNEKIIRHLVALAGGDVDVVIPQIHGHFEPLHAVYSIRCIAHIKDLINESDLKIINFLPFVKVVPVPESELTVYDPELRFVMNLNTPEDLEIARKLVK
jgi:molybdopterin-guanine dinucleotide biosynthesis protein A